MEEQKSAINLRTIAQLVVVLILIPLLPLLISSDWTWWEAWVYAIVFILGFIVSRGLAARRHPDLLAERSRGFQQEDTKSWDRYLAPGMAFGIVLILIVAGLERRISGPSSFSIGIELVAFVIILAGFVLGTYAMMENRFFSGTVRIQSDRGHQVVSSGPYRWIRHPGYAGTLLTYLATPFFLNSSWAILPALLICLLGIARTYLEDNTLIEELDGYRDYARRVRYRLVPGVW